ncbi:discoidin domain-containing protein [Paenarthrobacter sp. NPDC089316]|uniref:discoidin domain-containing protein n=1 Tax=unclassified Paenarthrobacter TaxID=2634190 RepID=UPI00342E561F
MTASQLQNAQQQVKAGVEPWASYYKAMSETKYAARDYVAGNQGPTDDTPLNNAYDQASMRGKAHTDSLGALTQALMYVMTGDEVYRANALHVLRTWSSMDPAKYKYFPDSHIHTGVPLYQFVSAAEIIRSTQPVNPDLNGYDLRWTERDQQRAKDNMVLPTIRTFLYSQNRLWNQHLYGVIGMLSGAIFIDDPQLYAERVEWFSVNSTYQINGTINGGDVNGSLSALLREVKSDDPRNPLGHDFVELVEMGRDQAHAEGDITLLGSISRMINNQGTRLDPVHGTVSQAADAVSPYGFLGNRLLKGADKYVQFMMGEEVPFIDTSGGSSSLSQAYRGRLRDMMSEIYYQYKYVEGVDVEREAPYVAELHEKRDGPLYYNGAGIENFWNPRGSDFNPADYWVAFPAQLANENVSVPVPGPTAEMSTAQYGKVIGKDAKQKTAGGEEFIRLDSHKDDAVLAVRRMVWSDRTKTSLVGIKVRTNGTATLQAARTANSTAFAEIALPDTAGAWTYAWVDLDSNKIPTSKVGENILFLRAKDGSPQIDVSGVLSQANGLLTPPVFKDAPGISTVAVAGEQFSRNLVVTDSGGAPSLSLQGAPAGASLAVDGRLAWTPQSGADVAAFLAVANDGQTTSALPVTISVAANRQDAIDKLLSGVQDQALYTSSSWAALVKAKDAALAGKDSTDAAGFGTLLEGLRQAVQQLAELNPKLEDGSLDFTKVVTSSQISASTLGSLIDGSNQTTWGDLPGPAVVFDAGTAYRLRVDRFGFLARDTFPDRTRGTSVYGSSNGSDWTLLTEAQTVGQDNALEYLPVKQELRNQSYRFLKFQLEGAQPAGRVWSVADLRIEGERRETVGAMNTVTLGSPNATAGRVVDGDTAELRFTGAPQNSNISVIIQGQPATVTAEEPGTWLARRALQGGEGAPLTFAINFTAPEGKAADPVEATSDGSGLFVSSNTGLVDSRFASAAVLRPNLQPSSTHTADAAKLFDNNATTYTDTRQFDGVYGITWDFGPNGSVKLGRAEILLRQDGYGTSRVRDLRLEGSNDGQNWKRLTPAAPKSVLPWQPWTVNDNSQYRYVRLVNGDIMGVAELRLYGS